MIPDGWSEHFLGDVCKISSGVGFPLKFQGRKDLPIPFIKVSDMNSEGNEKYVCSANNTIDSQIQEYVKAPIFPKGCLILPKVGAALLTNKRRILAQPTAVDNNVMVLMSKSVNYEFLYYWSLLIDMADYVQSGALPSINKSTISQIQITLPPEKEQKKIAAILTSVDDAIQATQGVIDQTRRVKQGLLQQLLTRGIGHSRFKQTEIGEIPEGWEVRSLDEVSKVIDSLHKTPVFSDAGIPMVRVTEIKGGLLNLEGAKKVSEAVYAEFSKSYTPKRGDIVLSRVGTYGASCFVDTDEIFCMGQNTVVISPLIEGIFLFQQLQSPWIRDQIENGVVGSSQKTVSLRTLKGLKILVPTFVERMKISEVLTNVDEKIRYEENILMRYCHLKRGLMQDLLTGRVRVKSDEVNTT